MTVLTYWECYLKTLLATISAFSLSFISTPGKKSSKISKVLCIFKSVAKNNLASSLYVDMCPFSVPLDVVVVFVFRDSLTL